MFSCNLPPALLAGWSGSFTCYCSNTKVERIPIYYKSRHRKLTLEKKILLPLQQGFEPVTFQSRVRRSNHWAIPAPQLYSSHHQKSQCWLPTKKHSSVQFKMVSMHLKKPMHALLTISQKFTQCHLWNGSSVYLIDNGHKNHHIP